MDGRRSLGTVLLCALSLSIGWGVRGNWGHEYGAMIPGALAAMAAVICIARADWLERIAYFAFFGALGWSFGGSISYMIVIGYTHSGHLPSVIYGFACLFVIGYLWGALGGAGTALPAFLDERRLRGLLPPLLAVFAAWALEDILFAAFPGLDDAWSWYDTDWPAALLAIIAVLLLSAWQRRISEGSSLVLHAAVGWWIGFLLLVVLLGLRMTPPRGDNWAGILGMTCGVQLFLVRRNLVPVLHASIVCGLFGGLGFSLATLWKLILILSGAEVNYHSILEQTYGAINGVGVAVALLFLARRAPPLSRDTTTRVLDWTESFALVFTLVGITYLNIRKNVESVWLPNKVVPESMLGLSAGTWFHLVYSSLAAVVIYFALRHRRRPLALLPVSELGRSQLLYLLFLWWIVVGNLSRYLPFSPLRLVTEGVIHLHACVASVLVILVPGEGPHPPLSPATDWSRVTRRTAALSAAVALLAIAAETGIVRGAYGDGYTGPRHASLHIRFGPGATHLKKP